MPRSYPGSTPGIAPWSKGVIPRRFKRKKNFVTYVRTDERTETWTDRRDGRNSYLDEKSSLDLVIVVVAHFSSITL